MVLHGATVGRCSRIKHQRCKSRAPVHQPQAVRDRYVRNTVLTGDSRLRLFLLSVLQFTNSDSHNEDQQSAHHLWMARQQFTTNFLPYIAVMAGRDHSAQQRRCSCEPPVYLYD